MNDVKLNKKKPATDPSYGKLPRREVYMLRHDWMTLSRVEGVYWDEALRDLIRGVGSYIASTIGSVACMMTLHAAMQPYTPALYVIKDLSCRLGSHFTREGEGGGNRTNQMMDFHLCICRIFPN